MLATTLMVLLTILSRVSESGVCTLTRSLRTAAMVTSSWVSSWLEFTVKLNNTWYVTFSYGDEEKDCLTFSTSHTTSPFFGSICEDFKVFFTNCKQMKVSQ